MCLARPESFVKRGSKGGFIVYRSHQDPARRQNSQSFTHEPFGTDYRVNLHAKNQIERVRGAGQARIRGFYENTFRLGNSALAYLERVGPNVRADDCPTLIRQNT